MPLSITCVSLVLGSGPFGPRPQELFSCRDVDMQQNCERNAVSAKIVAVRGLEGGLIGFPGRLKRTRWVVTIHT